MGLFSHNAMKTLEIQAHKFVEKGADVSQYPYFSCGDSSSKVSLTILPFGPFDSHPRRSWQGKLLARRAR